MIVTFRGTKIARNNAPQYLAACAVCSANVHSMKTVVLQFTNEYPIEKLLVGKRKAFDTESRSYISTGMDEIYRRVSTQGLNKDNFIMSITPIFEQERILDIATVSPSLDLYNAIIKVPSYIKSILDVAQDIYDNVFILLDGKDELQLEVFDDVLKDKEHYSVICLPQGNEQEVYSGGKQSAKYCIAEYDRRSIFSTNYFKNKYATKEIYAIPYNISFKDAYMNNDALMFCLNNSRVNTQSEDIIELEDTNANFIHAIRELTESIITRSEKKSDDNIKINKGYSFVPEPTSTLDTGYVKTMLEKSGKEITTYSVLSNEVITPETDNEPCNKRTAKAVQRAAKKQEKADKKASKKQEKLDKINAKALKKQKKTEKKDSANDDY